MYKLIIIICMLLLSSCSSFKKKDGPPPYHVDASRVHDAIPKVEPLSKYGNMPSYRVFGKRYYTLHSSRNYAQVGTASWYGIKFHERHTSSGEPYNMLAMTAAHKTLPLPTYVEVTNLRNHRKVIVKVNDRGPFESNRLIDLSYVAAIKLGMIGHGTAPVSVKAIDPITKKPYARMVRKNIYLQVGALQNKVHALQLKQRLTPLIHAPITVARFSAEHYQVRIGPIRDIAIARAINSKLKRLRLTAHASQQTIS